MVNNKSDLGKTVRVIRFRKFSKTTDAIHFQIFFKFAHQPPSHEGVFRGARVSSLPTNLILPILNFSYSDFCFLFFLIDDSRFEFLTSLL